MKLKKNNEMHRYKLTLEENRDIFPIWSDEEDLLPYFFLQFVYFNDIITSCESREERIQKRGMVAFATNLIKFLFGSSHHPIFLYMIIKQPLFNKI